MRDDIIIYKMAGYCEKVLSYCVDKDYESFSDNMQLAEACVFNLSQIGELVAKLSVLYTQNHPDIPWSQIRGLRNRIVHDYEGVNLVLIWEIISNDLPDLLERLSRL